MSVRNLDRLFRPASVALIGATDRAGSVGSVVMRNLQRAGFRGALTLVNPHHRELGDARVYPDVASLPEAPDLAVIVTPPATVPGLIAELGARGTRAAVVVTAGFGESGDKGKALQQATLDAARPHLLRLVGPNCVGVMVPGIGLDASFSHLAPPPGHLAFVSQSGAMITAMLDWAAPRGIGFSHVVSLGDMADVDFGDMLDYLAADAQTRAILLYVEGITHGRKFMSAARAAARAKPVLVLKAGHSAAGAKAAHSHTGALAGSDAVYDAAFARAGMLRVGTMAELFEATETLALTRAQKGERLAIVSNGGGAGVLATDALAAQDGKLAALAPDTIAALDKVLPATWSRGNPIDIIGDAPGARYAAALDKVLADGNVDALLVLNCPTALASPDEAAQAVIDTVRAHPTAGLSGRNLFTAWLGEQTAAPARRLFEAAGIPTYETPEAAVAGFLHRVRYQRNQALLMETPPSGPDRAPQDVAAVEAAIAKALAAGQSWLDADGVATVLSAYDIPQPLARNVGTADDAAAAAGAIGFPVALKIRSPDITHKSDVGGVALGLRDKAAVRDAAATMLDRVRAVRPEARIDGILVQQMIERPGAVELLAGLGDDAVFGPVVVFGQGGTAVEVVRDSAIALPPLDPLLARAQMERTRVWSLLQAYRSKPAAAIDAIAGILIRLGDLAADHPEIQELDINPLLADAGGVVALDARIRVAAAAVPGASRLAIAPYPRHIETIGAARDGTPIALRPVRPEDEPLLQDLFAHMSAEDKRLRFFAAMRELGHALAARLSQIDYDREMALIALHDGVPLGVARYAADPDRLRAEYAVAVRSDWKGCGVGHLLMTRLIDVARAAGIGELSGEVLRENKPMLDMCRALGFTVAENPTDAGRISVRKPLREGG
ncbi:MAG TPA: bifunctional acetate--CoA ligase family protein/GNAT family N-acetyltransferase [Stellaceae bacterium]|nr:bifunctional acetate--CoA ligase family protein/GNAT family N-acetyltransferase [Stellaceae bacterium]